MTNKRRIFTLKRVGLGFLLLFLAMGLSMMSWGIPKQNHTLSPVEVASKADGVYRGQYKIVPPFGTFVANREFAVALEVYQGRIVDVAVEEPREMQEAFPYLVATIINDQSIAIDSLSGATWSKLAFLKAAEDALLQK